MISGVFSKSTGSPVSLDHSPRDFLPVESSYQEPTFSTHNVLQAVNLIFEQENYHWSEWVESLKSTGKPLIHTLPQVEEEMGTVELWDIKRFLVNSFHLTLILIWDVIISLHWGVAALLDITFSLINNITNKYITLLFISYQISIIFFLHWNLIKFERCASVFQKLSTKSI